MFRSIRSPCRCLHLRLNKCGFVFHFVDALKWYNQVVGVLDDFNEAAWLTRGYGEQGGEALLEIEKIKAKIRDGNYRLTVHAVLRTKERGITTADMEAAIFNGEIIKEYPTDKPFPSCLICGHTPDGSPLHVVCSLAPVSDIITFYFPDEKLWIDYKTRRDNDE